jgi:hypothetical protein
MVCIATYLQGRSQLLGILDRKLVTYRNVPAENNRRTPVRQRALASSVVPDPRRCTNKKVAKAPTGAAKLKTNKCVLAARLERPCLRRTEVSPNDAGAL